MRIGGRMQAAIEVLDDIEARKRPASISLRDWGSSHRFAGSADRAAIGNLVYDALRKQASQSWRMDDGSSASLVYATLFGQWGISPPDLAQLLEEDRYAPAPLPESHAVAWMNRDLVDAPDHIRADLPQWSASSFREVFASDWIEEGVALSDRPPLDLRANTLKADQKKICKQLSRFDAQETRLAANGVRIPPGAGDARLPNVQAEAGYRKGWFEIQDEGSQLAAFLAGTKPGEQVLDLCAGAGGKTLFFAAAMNNRGQVHAYDADRNRLAPIHERIRRAGARNVQVYAPESVLTELREKMDCVFVDAPCSGSGTWRRRPDAKWRFSERNLADRIAEQDTVLRDAAQYVAPGGRLVYVTCSLLPKENRDRIDGFLQSHPHFHLQSPHDRGIETPVGARPISQDGSMLQLSPLATGTDGFFIACLARG